jgi:nucleoside-diphosphate-sugar epimerase
VRILVTGSSGLIGSGLVRLAERRGWEVRCLDVRRDPGENLLTPGVLEAAAEGVDGVVHLAAVSRVVWAERDPDLCQATNVAVLERLLRIVSARSSKPWLVFASSREVYGEAEVLPVREDAPLQPMNVYARSKVAGERIVARAAEAGLQASICRFSSVYGSVGDHPDRVAMAFAGTAARGGTMRVEGVGHTFDFTHVDDVSDGLLRLVEATAAEGRQPTIHYASGIGTTLAQLAGIAAGLALAPVTIEAAPPRTFDVGRFVGDPALAEHLLGWRATRDLGAGMSRLIGELARSGPA